MKKYPNFIRRNNQIWRGVLSLQGVMFITKIFILKI